MGLNKEVFMKITLENEKGENYVEEVKDDIIMSEQLEEAEKLLLRIFYGTSPENGFNPTEDSREKAIKELRDFIKNNKKDK